MCGDCNRNHGIHGFITRIRNQDMTIVAGVRIEDMGHKMGLNGVDNGKLWFDHVHVPRTALLDSQSQVSRDGSFTSSVEGCEFSSSPVWLYRATVQVSSWLHSYISQMRAGCGQVSHVDFELQS